jgi:hypothetical protein
MRARFNLIAFFFAGIQYIQSASARQMEQIRNVRREIDPIALSTVSSHQIRSRGEIQLDFQKSHIWK